MQESSVPTGHLNSTHTPRAANGSYRWLKQNEPESFAKMAKVMLPHDYINFQLTGVYAMEPGDASGIGIMDMHSKQFDKRLCDFVDTGLYDMLPALASPDAPLGKNRVSSASYSLGG